jgi:hypothetical protein
LPKEKRENIISIMRSKFYIFIIAIIFLPIIAMSQVPQITVEPQRSVLCLGESGLLSLTATGAEPLTYTWYKDDVALTGINENTIEFNPVELADAGVYYCKVSNAEGNDSSQIVQIVVVAEAPEIVDFSSGDYFCEGNDVTLSVSATPGPLGYFWYKDDQLISGAYASTYVINDITPSDAAVYQCEVVNACGTAHTGNIPVNVTETISILSQPVGQTVCEGDDAVFTINAEGSSLSYQWFDNGMEIPGENLSQLTIENVQSDNSSSYYCVVSNACGSIESNMVGLTVHTYPQVTAHPMSTSACFGETVNLTSTATGTPTIVGQWFVNGELVPDVESSTLSLDVDSDESQDVYRVFTNGCGTISSDTAEVSIKHPPIITQQPVDSTTCLGNNASFSVKVIGAEPFYYQWQFEGADVNGSSFSGENQFELNISSVHQGHIGQYTCIVSNVCGSVVSDPAALNVLMPPSIISQPNDLAVCENDTAIFEIDVQGNEPFEYAWMKLSSDEIISTEQNLEINTNGAVGADDYYCVVSNVCADISTDTVSLHVKTLPEFVVQPQELDACHGDSVAIEVSVSGTSPMDLLWFRNNGAISGAEDSVLILDPAETLETGYFFCVAMNECGIIESDEVYVNIIDTPAITWQPYDKSLCENDMLTLYSGASGDNLSYQWFNNGEEISGQNDTILEILAIDGAMEGTFYFQASNGCAAVNSNIVTVDIYPAPDINLGDNQDVCDGETVTLTSDVSAQSYNWNDGMSTGASLDVYSSGEYSLAAIGENGCTGYDTVFIEFHPYYDLDLGSDLFNCGPLTLDAGEGAFSYEWNTGSIEQSIEVEESGMYYCTTEGDAFGCISNDTVVIEILEVPHVDLGDNHTISVDSSVNLSIDDGFLSYYWSNGTNLHEAVYDGDYLGLGTHEVWVSVTAENGCITDDTVQIVVVQAESVEQVLKGEMLAIYPNPANEMVTIEFDLKESLDKLNVLDVNGRVVLSINENQYKGMRNIDLNALQSGLYIINLQTKSRSINYRLIKE